MRMRKVRNVVVGVMVMAGVASLVGWAPVAQADPPSTWSQNVSYHLDYLTTTPDGKVSAANCATGSTGYDDLRILSSTGASLGAHTRASSDQLAICGNSSFMNSAITANGTVVGRSYDSTTYKHKAVAYSSSGTSLWSFDYPNLCGSKGRSYGQQSVASDGSVYFTMESLCPSGARYELVNLDADDGSVNFHVPLSPSSGRLAFDGLRAYSGGYVYYDEGATEFVYLSQNGVKDTTKSFVLGTTYYNKSVMWALGASGKLSMFVGETVSSGSGCISTDTSRLFTRVPGQTIQSWVLAVCSKSMLTIYSMPGGETLLYTSNDKRIHKIGNDGSIIFTVTASEAGNINPYSWHGAKLAVDTQGNILATITYTTSGASVNAAKIVLFSPNGTIISRFDTNAFLAPNQINQVPQTVRSVGLVNGAIYALISTYSGTDAVLHKIPFAKVSIDYPRGTLLGDTSVPTVKKYVALGDSYSSGESVEPFIPGTAIELNNECHRSTLAYPRLLAENPSLNLVLDKDDFRACSGAVIDNITTIGQWGEFQQMQHITQDTDIVTITIGGNNIPFTSFATYCFYSDCGFSSTAYQSARAGAENVDPYIRSMFDTIKNRLTTVGNTDVRVLVIGYPNLLQNPYVAPILTSDCSPWLGGTEAAAINEVQNVLNTSIQNAVIAKGGPFEYVSATESTSPFAGHEICRNSNDAFFNGIVPSPAVYSFHPNQKGQNAYASLLKSYLQQNP